GVAASRIKTISETARRYYDAAEARDALRVAQADLQRRRESRRLAEARYRLGEVPETDFLEAQVSELDAEINVDKAQATSRSLELVLLEQLGLTAIDTVPVLLPETSFAELQLDDSLLV